VGLFSFRRLRNSNKKPLCQRHKGLKLLHLFPTLALSRFRQILICRDFAARFKRWRTGSSGHPVLQSKQRFGCVWELSGRSSNLPFLFPILNHAVTLCQIIFSERNLSSYFTQTNQINKYATLTAARVKGKPILMKSPNLT